MGTSRTCIPKSSIYAVISEQYLLGKFRNCNHRVAYLAISKFLKNLELLRITHFLIQIKFSVAVYV